MLNKKFTKKLAVSSVAFMATAAVLMGTPVQAASAKFTSTTKNTTSIAIEDVDYDLDNQYEAIEFDFLSNVRLKKSATVSVKDDSKKSYKASINEHDDDDLSLNVKGLKTGKSYTVKIKGIKKSTASKYGTLTVKFSIPKSVKVSEVDYDADDKEVTFDFNQKVTYKNAKVKITSSDGSTSYKTVIVEKDSDDLVVRVPKIKNGKTYKYVITGVKGNNDTSYTKITGSFKAIDND